MSQLLYRSILFRRGVTGAIISGFVLVSSLIAAPTAAGQDRATKLRVVAYNVACGQWATPEQIAEVLKPLKPDIVLLNEVPKANAGKDVKDWSLRMAEALDLDYVHVGTASSAGHKAPKWGDITGDYGGKFKSINSLQQKWVYQTHPSLFYTAPYLQNQSAGVASTLAIAGDKIFFGANDGRLYCLGIEAGEYIWSRNLGSPILGDVLIEGEDMVVSDYAGNLYKFDITSVLKIKHNTQGVSVPRNRFED